MYFPIRTLLKTVSSLVKVYSCKSLTFFYLYTLGWFWMDYKASSDHPKENIWKRVKSFWTNNELNCFIAMRCNYKRINKFPELTSTDIIIRKLKLLCSFLFAKKEKMINFGYNLWGRKESALLFIEYYLKLVYQWIYLQQERV